MTLGHQYLLDRFNLRVRVGWQIDPFGHDSRVAQLFAEMGLDALVINRVHHKIKTMMKDEKALEFLWRFPEYTGSNYTELFTHTLHTHYSAPFGFDFENRGVPRITSASVEKRAEEFVSELKKRAGSFRTPHLMITFGDDFKFQNSELQFTNMDKLITYVNANYKDIAVRYATASEYFDHVFAYSRKNDLGFPIVQQDFVPYADNEDSYWTGYYSSLPNLKKRVRDAEGSLAAAERSALLTRAADTVIARAASINWLDIYTELQAAKETVALVQHHDSITGTCRKEVYDDYMNRLANSLTSTNRIQKTMISALLAVNDKSTIPIILHDHDEILEHGKLYGIIVHNPDSDRRSRLVRIRGEAPYAVVKDPQGQTILSQSAPVLFDGSASKWLTKPLYDTFFAVDMPGFSTQKISVLLHGATEDNEHEQTSDVLYFADDAPDKPDAVTVPDTVKKEIITQPKILLQNDYYEIFLDSRTGYIESITERLSSTIHQFSNQFTEYESGRSGSYIFRTAAEARDLSGQALKYIHLTKGPLFEQAIVVTNRLTITIRLPTLSKQDDPSAEYIQMNYDIHQLPINTELATRFSVMSDNTAPQLLVYDGKNIVKRIVHPEAPLPGHIYPTQSGAILKYSTTQLTVLTGQTMGVTSWGNQLEFLVHRRLGKDDGRGMSQANNDISTLVVPFFFRLKTKKGFSAESVVKMHAVSHTINLPFSVYVTDQPEKFRPEFHVLNNNKLNSALHILTLAARDYVSDDIVLRIQNFSPVEDIYVDLRQLFEHNFISFVNIRKKSLNLVYDLPSKRTIHEMRPQLKGTKLISFSFTANVQSKNGASQNTQEEGVFLSDEAIAMAKKNRERETQRIAQGQRKILAVQENAITNPERFLIPANSIVSFLAQIRLYERVLALNVEKEAEPIVIQKPKEIEDDDNEKEPPKEIKIPEENKNDLPEHPNKEILKGEEHQKLHDGDENFVEVGEWVQQNIYNPPENSVTEEQQSSFGFYFMILILLVVAVVVFMLRKRFKRAWHKVRRNKQRSLLPETFADDGFKSH